MRVGQNMSPVYTLFGSRLLGVTVCFQGEVDAGTSTLGSGRHVTLTVAFPNPTDLNKLAPTMATMFIIVAAIPFLVFAALP